MEALWAIGWGLIALISWLAGAPEWAWVAALIIGGLAVPVIIFDGD